MRLMRPQTGGIDKIGYLNKIKHSETAGETKKLDKRTNLSVFKMGQGYDG